MIRLKRAYDPPSPDDGRRILVERLWPRGITKQRAALDLWLKEIAPTPALRKWFAHDPKKWKQFQQRYWKELQDNPAAAVLRDKVREGPVTLIYAAKDEQHNGALALMQFLEKRLQKHGK
ncbi:MAG TPA: DUF488 domain-containing protein [Tepidisphaeraceae bacterium]|nr:DUF488 domain-containing protein [Tepidisphaeraceae bacterium]